jgi:flagellar biosynthesis component FlhA
MNLLAEESAPGPLTYGSIVTALALFIALLWKSSRGDKDATIAAQAAEIKDHQERERQSWKDREAAAESRIRMAAAMEEMARNQRDFQREFGDRLAQIERKVLA